MLQDLSFALRLIAKERWFSAAAIVVLALGIGVNATGFTLVKGVFLRGRSLVDGNQVYVLSWRGPERRAAFSYPDFDDWRTASRAFAHLAAITNPTLNISDERGLPEQVFGARITSDAFAVFEQQPLIGRVFSPDDERPGAQPAIMVSERLWRARYGADPSALGATLRVNGIPSTIVGVMPDGIRFPGNAELWLPMIPTEPRDRSARALLVFGRLTAGISRRAATAEAQTIAQRIIAADPAGTKGFDGIVVDTVPERFVGGSARTMFLVMLAAVSFVLVIACANVANLLLSRSVYRAREVALRMMLGATRARVVRQLLVESVLLASIGGAIGLLLAYGGVRLFDAAVLDTTRPYWIVFVMDYPVFGYVAAVCVLTAILAGLAPALHISKDNSHELVNERARGSLGSARTRWFSGAMVVAQLALTIVLLTGAGLMARSFYNLRGSDIGYETEEVRAMRLQLPNATYSTPDSRRQFFEQLEARLAAIPGVVAAAVTTAVPPLNNEERRLEIEGVPATDAPPQVGAIRIGARFFGVVDRTLLRGRDLAPQDATPGSEGVVINARLAQQFFTNSDPIGHRLRFLQRQSDGALVPTPWRTIVGVSPSVRHSAPGDPVSDPVVYVPYADEPPTSAWVMLRTPLPPGALFDDVRRAVQSIDRDQPVFTLQTIDQLLEERQWPYTAFGGAFAIFALIALVLASVGLYAVMAYSVSQRTPEIGVRMAVGARTSQVLWLFLRRGLIQLSLGVALGLAGAFALSGVLQAMLVNVTPGDPATFVGVTIVLSAVATTACLLPARRAATIDPLQALRQD